LYRLRHIPALLRTPTGRNQLRLSLWLALWPLLNPVAALYRRLVVNRTRVVAVVGSYGKTTTTAVVSSVLLGRLPRTEDNFLSRLAEGLLRIRPGDGHAVMEVGISQPGEMVRYRRLIRPDVVVVTAVGPDHIVFFPNQQAIRAEKAEMIRSLDAAGVAVLNGDDPNVMWMRDRTRGQVVTYGLGEHNDVRATDISLADWPDGTVFTLHAAGRTRRVRMRLIGQPMVRAALAAVAAGLAEGLPLDLILQRLRRVPPIPRRMEPVRLTSGAVVLRDCSKGTQEAVEAALDALAEIPAKRRIVVLGLIGDAGADPERKHRTIGRRLGRVADRAVLLCQEFDDDCAAGAIEAGLSDDAITRLGKDLFAAVRVLEAELTEGDVALVAGWGWLRLERIDLLLAGEPVRCRLAYCSGRGMSCLACPARKQGWPAPLAPSKPNPLGPMLPDEQGPGTRD